MKNMSALSLTQWSHQEGSPWYDTLYIKTTRGIFVDKTNGTHPFPKN